MRVRRRAWRHRLSARRRPSMRKGLAVLLLLECLIGGRQLFLSRLELPVRIETDERVEWVLPGEGTEDSRGFGIRFDIQEGELIIYRFQREIADH